MNTPRLRIKNLTKGKLPRLPFLDLKNECLGNHFEVSLVFVGEKRAHTLNKRYRGKKYIPAILTFPLNKESGEIFICSRQAKRDAKKFEMTHEQFLGYLLIHGLIHLKGEAHGSTMNRKEEQMRKKFGI